MCSFYLLSCLVDRTSKSFDERDWKLQTLNSNVSLMSGEPNWVSGWVTLIYKAIALLNLVCVYVCVERQ